MTRDDERPGTRSDLQASQIAGLPLRHPRRVMRWVGAAIVLLVVAVMVYTLVNNQNFEWGTVGDYLFSSPILHGLLLTLKLTVVAMAIGIVGGILLALMRASSNPFLTWASAAYIWFFRGTPVLVQLVFWFFLAALFPTISIGIPFGGPVFAHGDANTLITPWVAALLGLGLNEAAYMAEIVRGGLRSVDEGQIEAARALAMSFPQVTRKIVLPQAMRVIVPPTGNQVIGMLKLTALVSTLSLSELLYSAQLIYAKNYEEIPLLIVVSIWYLACTSVLSVGQIFLERRFSRGVATRGTRRARTVQPATAVQA